MKSRWLKLSSAHWLRLKFKSVHSELQFKAINVVSMWFHLQSMWSCPQNSEWFMSDGTSLNIVMSVV